MLKKIPNIISPDLMKVLMEMGHSDTILFADANYPAHTNAQKILRLEGVEILDLLEAVLVFFPLDSYVDHPVTLMGGLPDEPVPDIWEKYQNAIDRSEERAAFTAFQYLERLTFYEESKKAYAIVQLATTARYANIMLQKGVV